MGDRRNQQGKRDDQIAFSEGMVALSLMGIIVLITIGVIYHIISGLIHYIMG